MTNQEKQCTTCHQSKSLDEFRYLTAQRRYMSTCKQCEKAYHKANYMRAKNELDPIGRKVTVRRAYAVRAIRNYIATFGKEILDEAQKDAT